MIRGVVRVAAACFAGLISLGASQEPSFRGGTNTVSLYTTVLDREGRFVSGLTRDDFDVFDNGVRQPLVVFAADRQPITIVVMLDRSGSMRQHFSLVRDATEEFVRHLWPEDRIRIGSFSDRVQIDPATFTTDREELARILREELQEPGATPLWNATSAAMNALASQDGRRVVVLFTDGEDAPQYGNQNVSVGAIKARAEVEDVMIYGIGLTEACAVAPQNPFAPGAGGRRFQRGRGRGPIGGGRLPPIGMPPPGRPPGVPGPGFPPTVPSLPPSPPWLPPTAPRRGYREGCVGIRPDPDLRDVSAIGGGGYFELDSTANLRSTFSRIADELHQQYLLAFTASKLDNTLHRLEVRVKDRSLTVRARRTYFAGPGAN